MNEDSRHQPQRQPLPPQPQLSRSDMLQRIQELAEEARHHPTTFGGNSPDARQEVNTITLSPGTVYTSVISSSMIPPGVLLVVPETPETILTKYNESTPKDYLRWLVTTAVGRIVVERLDLDLTALEDNDNSNAQPVT